MEPQSARIPTERLVLVPLEVSMARRIVAGDLRGVLASPGWPHDETIEALAVAVEAGDAAPPGWLVVRRLDREIIGDCGWHAWPDAAGEVEIGYGLAAPVRGQGYGTELVTALVDWTARQAGVRRIVARVATDNVVSRRLLRRAGFVQDGEVEGRLVLQVA